MKIIFLGTGAADWPKEKNENLTEFRRLSSAIIDGVLLIDPGPQVLTALEEFNIKPENIKYIINTHRHSDHFCADTLSELQKCGAEFLEFNENETKETGSYKITALRGNHGTCENTHHFMISSGDKTIFYGLDSAWLLYDEIKSIKEIKPDLAVLDATIGDIEGDYRIFEHNNLNMVLEMKKTLNPYIKKFCISHMARTLHTDHKTLSDKMEKFGVITAYDGLEIEI